MHENKIPMQICSMHDPCSPYVVVCRGTRSLPDELKSSCE